MGKTPQAMDTDTIWAIAMLFGTVKERAAIREALQHANGDRCPGCSSQAVTSNGAAWWTELTYCCMDCGHLWDAAEVEVELPRAYPRRPR